MNGQTTANGDAPVGRRVPDSRIRLARALARSLERDRQAADEQVLAIAALPLPEDEHPAA